MPGGRRQVAGTAITELVGNSRGVKRITGTLDGWAPRLYIWWEIMLKRLGYRVLVSGTPVRTLALAEQHAGNIDLLMTDVVMPAMSRRDLANQIQSFNPEIKTAAVPKIWTIF